MIALDASVMIAHLDAGDASHDTAAALMRDAAASPLCASVLTIAEVLVASVRTGRTNEMQRDLETIGVSPVEIATSDAAHLARLRSETGLKLPDCCVLLAADRAGASGVATFDYRLAEVARSRGLAVLGAG